MAMNEEKLDEEKRLVGAMPESFTASELSAIRKAFNYSLKVLTEQNFPDAEKIIRHNVNFAINVAKLGVDSETVEAALLHTIWTEENVRREIEKEFKSEIVRLLRDFDKYKTISYERPELARKVFIAMSNDVSFVLLQLAHSLEDLRRLDEFPIEKKNIFLRNVADIYIPLTAKLGIYSIKSELEDTLFRETEPEIYSELERKVRSRSQRYEGRMEKVRELLARKLREAGIDAEVKGRAKHLYSIYEKMKRKNLFFEQIYDLIGLRIVTNSTKECYETLGIVHSTWRPMLGEFDDYIAKPKPNGYQSIHTAVSTDEGDIIEVQIRTKEQDMFAEIGGAAHWKYKGEKESKQDRKFAWLKQLIAWQNEYGKIFSAATKADFFGSEIFVLTPKNEVVELPEGATALDFAYAIHRDIGNRADKIKVNGKSISFDYALQNGDKVEVITSEKASPKRHWLNFVKTEKARTSIMKALGIKMPSRKIATKEVKAKNILELKENDPRIRFAKCCMPRAGDEIVGFLTTKRKIMVHNANCKEGAKNPQKINIQISGWGVSEAKEGVCEITVIAADKLDVLSRILATISSKDVSLLSASAKAVESNMIECKLELRAKRDVFGRTIQSLRETDGVMTVDRG